MSELKHRLKEEMPSPDAGAGFNLKEGDSPAGPIKHGGFVQAARMLGFFLFFLASIHAGQWMVAWLYFVNHDYYYAVMAVTKQWFYLLLASITRWFAPSVIRVSGDESVRGQLKLDKNGNLETAFPERLIYTEWMFFWWISYTSKLHGHIYIILKESLKYIPVIGPGMMFYSFIFLARNWLKDKPRFQHRLQKLKSRHSGPLSGSQSLDPMWLLIFPEGTNLCPNGRKSSQKWAAKQNIPDMQHQLLPRTTGLQFCLQELEGTVDYIYDCTLAYEGIPRGQYGQDIFTLRSTYFQGRPPKSVSMYWRRFKVDTIPVDDAKAFDEWLRARWAEKDGFIEHYIQTGEMPASEWGVLETAVKTKSPFEFLQIFIPLFPVIGIVYLVKAALRALR